MLTSPKAFILAHLREFSVLKFQELVAMGLKKVENMVCQAKLR